MFYRNYWKIFESWESPFWLKQQEAYEKAKIRS